MSDGWLMDAVEEVWEEERRESDLLFPEHNRLDLIKEEADVIAAFLGWMEVQGWLLADNTGFPVDLELEEVLAQYFDIDLDKIAEEKNQLLEKIRNA